MGKATNIQSGNRFKTAVVTLALSVVALSAAACTNPEVPAGHEGYIYYKPLIFGKMEYRESLRGPASTGMSWRLYAIVVDMRARSYNEHFELLTSDNLKVSFEVNTRIKPKDTDVKKIVEDWGGDDWYKLNVREPLRTVVRETVTEFHATAIQLDTSKVKALLHPKLTRMYKDSPFSILSVDIGDIKFPQQVADAINRKTATTERLKQQKYVLAKTRKDAAISVLEALRVAKQQRIISETLDPMYVQRKAVNVYKRIAKSKNKTVIMLPNSTNGTGMPLVLTKGKRKILTAADKELLKSMENKYMDMARSSVSTGDDSSADGDSTKPDTTKPDTTKPDTTKPDTTKPDTTKPKKLPMSPSSPKPAAPKSGN